MGRMFCVHCGAEIIENTVNCPDCGREHDPKERLFREFLIRHTKDELKGKASDRLFSILKNWLLSHLYGTVLTVSVVAVLTNAAAAGLPDYEIVSGRPEILSSAPVGAVSAQENGEQRPISVEESSTAGEETLSETERGAGGFGHTGKN